MPLQAIDDPETLWDHLTTPEKTCLASLVIEWIDHDPADSSFSIPLTPTGRHSKTDGRRGKQLTVRRVYRGKAAICVSREFKRSNFRVTCSGVQQW